MGEKSLHNAIKNWYAQQGDQMEALVDGYIVDIKKDDLLVEIQTRNFSAIKNKLAALIKTHQVRLVYPVSEMKWIVRVDRKGERILSRRRSPKRGRVEDLFTELVYIPQLLDDSSFEIEVLMLHSEDILIDDGKGSWRRRRWSIHDRRMLKVVEQRLFKTPGELASTVPTFLENGFTTRQLAEKKRMPLPLTRKMIYCLRKMGLLENAGYERRAPTYRRTY
jgi:hypothetical protein